MNLNDQKKNEMKNLISFLLEIEQERNLDVINKELAESGLDPKELLAEGTALIQKLIGKKKLELAKTKYEAMKKDIQNVIFEKIQATKENAKEVLLKLLSGENKTAFQANFRNLEGVSDEEAIEILNEAQLLEIYSKLKAEENL